jgi:hypothetical protein
LLRVRRRSIQPDPQLLRRRDCFSCIVEPNAKSFRGGEFERSERDRLARLKYGARYRPGLMLSNGSRCLSQLRWCREVRLRRREGQLHEWIDARRTAGDWTTRRRSPRAGSARHQSKPQRHPEHCSDDGQPGPERSSSHKPRFRASTRPALLVGRGDSDTLHRNRRKGQIAKVIKKGSRTVSRTYTSAVSPSRGNSSSDPRLKSWRKRGVVP